MNSRRIRFLNGSQRCDDDRSEALVHLVRGDHNARPDLADLMPEGRIEIDQIDLVLHQPIPIILVVSKYEILALLLGLQSSSQSNQQVFLPHQTLYVGVRKGRIERSEFLSGNDMITKLSLNRPNWRCQFGVNQHWWNSRYQFALGDHNLVDLRPERPGHAGTDQPDHGV